MQLTPVRLVAGGVVLTFLLAAAFVVGLRVGDEDSVGGMLGIPVDAALPAEPAPCPEPGFRSTRTATIRAEECHDARTLERMLFEAGALAANVNVRIEDSERLVGPATIKDVVVQVRLPEGTSDDWEARSAAHAIATTVGTTPDRVAIYDARLQPLHEIRPKRMDGSAKP